jgi:hypothetical protein
MKYSIISFRFPLGVQKTELMQIFLFGTDYLDLVCVCALCSFWRIFLSTLQSPKTLHGAKVSCRQHIFCFFVYCGSDMNLGFIYKYVCSWMALRAIDAMRLIKFTSHYLL